MHIIQSWFTWFMLLFAFIVSVFLALSGSYEFLSVLFPSILFFMAGIVGLWAAMGHLLVPENTAKGIGWKPGPFQNEMGFTNLALGIAGIFSPWKNLSYQFCLMLILSILWWGCAWVHIKDFIERKNRASHNVGPMLYTSIITPPLLWVIYYFVA